MTKTKSTNDEFNKTYYAPPKSNVEMNSVVSDKPASTKLITQEKIASACSATSLAVAAIGIASEYGPSALSDTFSQACLVGGAVGYTLSAIADKIIATKTPEIAPPK